MHFRYTIGALCALPLLPIMYYQGRKIRESVPRLPEAAGPEGRAGGPLPPRLRLLTIGESTIAGVGVTSHEEGFTGTLALELSQKLQTGVSWKVYAKSGYTAEKVKDKLIPRMVEPAADLIVIGLGGNDAFTLNRPWRWNEQVTGLIAALRNKYADTPIVFANMPPIKAFPAFTPLIRWTVGNLVELLGEELEQLTATLPGVYYYDRIITLEDWIERLQVRAEESEFFSDGVHPSKLTYQVWARDLSDFICQQEGIRQRLSSDP